MRIDFADDELRARALDQDEVKKAWGTAVGRKYIQAVNFLENAATIQDVRMIRGYQYKKLHEARWRGCSEMRLNDRYRLIVRPPTSGGPLVIM